MRYTEALNALVEKSPTAEPAIADLVRVAIETLAIDEDETAAATVLNLILLHDNLAEAIYGRL
jgi:hypothetical protein